MLSRDELLKEISDLLSDYTDRSTSRRSGFINPSDENLAEEEGQRRAFEDVVDSLKGILERANLEPAPARLR